eukprot:3519242-Alexandrium_andersonii.AAC.1
MAHHPKGASIGQAACLGCQTSWPRATSNKPLNLTQQHLAGECMPHVGASMSVACACMSARKHAHCLLMQICEFMLTDACTRALADPAPPASGRDGEG